MIYNFLPEAIIELAPNKAFVINGNFELKNVTWNENVPKSDIPEDKDIIKKCEELQAAEPMRLLRIERDRRLAETDWVAIKAFTQGTQLSLEWKTYLQALRDLPATAEPQLDVDGNLTNIIWPEEPE